MAAVVIMIGLPMHYAPASAFVIGRLQDDRRVSSFMFPAGLEDLGVMVIDEDNARRPVPRSRCRRGHRRCVMVRRHSGRREEKPQCSELIAFEIMAFGPIDNHRMTTDRDLIIAIVPLGDSAAMLQQRKYVMPFDVM